MTGGGWLKLWRKILEWENFQDARVLQMFIYLLAMAAPERRRKDGVVIYRGQVKTTYKRIAADLMLDGLGEDKARRLVAKLKKTKEIKTKRVGNWIVITICKYRDYQQPIEYRRQPSPDLAPDLAPDFAPDLYPTQSAETKSDTETLTEINTNFPTDLSTDSAPDPTLLYNKEDKEEKNIYYYYVDARTRADFLNLFFREDRKAELSTVCKNMGITPEQMKEYADAVIDEWILKGTTQHKNLTDATSHLLSHIRKIIKEGARAPEKTNEKRHGTTNKNRPGRGDGRTAKAERDAEFRADIAATLAGAGQAAEDYDPYDW